MNGKRDLDVGLYDLALNSGIGFMRERSSSLEIQMVKEWLIIAVSLML